MTSPKSEAIYREISQLSSNEKILLLSKLIAEISSHVGKKEKNNFYNIKGVGKKVWKGIDAQKYVDKERTFWK